MNRELLSGERNVHKHAIKIPITFYYLDLLVYFKVIQLNRNKAN